MSAIPPFAYDYRCQNGHVFSAPPAEHDGPWATLVCPECGSTGTREFPADSDFGAWHPEHPDFEEGAADV